MSARTTLAALDFGFCLAARPGTTQLPVAVFWVGAAIVGIVLATAVLYYIRRMAVSKEGRTRPGISVEAVEELHSQGLLSDEEYKRARRAALGLPSKSEVAGGS
ncbi:MAG: hypothetical protein AMJ81_10585, partial [Phycisphaerae bacterium SM23_33]